MLAASGKGRRGVQRDEAVGALTGTTGRGAKRQGGRYSDTDNRQSGVQRDKAVGTLTGTTDSRGCKETRR